MSPYPLNDVRQYDDLVDAWRDPNGAFAMLYWLAEARAALVPPARHSGELLVDVACGGGLFAPHAQARGYTHVGIDLSASGLRVARDRGVKAVQGDATLLPLRDAAADVVVAGEVLEHVADLAGVVGEVCRVLRPGGRVVIDTIADTLFGRLSSVTIAERIPGGPPPGIHDPALFVDRHRLRTEFARHGVTLQLMGLRPAVLPYLRWAWARSARRRRPGSAEPLPAVHLSSTRSTAGLFQGHGIKEASS
ncbi:MAG: 2-polyprenyl-6-hydroxyphenyl methylase / 3-demethylubiquinone-9 3-methyltransferase [Frankiaceae bacterium]|nr:2-polyprenyl-6-hydroxyphenyl methylase / 3-demethylubiquinone-9 3-methyltransferase [Frankiaceae bacterium]